MGATWLREILGQRCLSCGRAGSTLCPACIASLRLPPAAPDPEGVRVTCCPWSYEGASRALILALKLRALRTAAGPLVEGMVEAARQRPLLATTVTWVPGRRADIRQRGFDHAEILARGVARALGLPARPVLSRRGAGADQTSLSARDRASNVRGAFAASPAPGAVLLVDDLITTGATAAACAAALDHAGAEVVELVAAARA